MVQQLSALRVTADMDVSGYQRGAQAKVAADNAMSASGQQVGRALAAQDAAAGNTGGALGRLSRQYVDGYGSAAKFEAAVRSLQRGVETGNVPLDRAGLILQGLHAKYGLMADAAAIAIKGNVDLAAVVERTNGHLRATAPQMDAAAKAAGSTGHQMQQLGFQINDIATSLGSGSSPFQVLAQQGGQVYQALNGPGGVRQGLEDARDELAKMITPARMTGVALVAAAAAAYVAWSRYGDAQREAIRTLEGMGRGLGVTATGFEALAQRAASAGQISVASARELANELARTGNGISTQSIERLASVSKDFAATYTKGDVQEGMKKLTDLMGSGAEGIAAWGKSQNLYNLAQRTAIEEAVRHHDVNKAIDVTLEAMSGKLAKHSDTTSALAKAWEDIKRSISDIITAFGPYIDRMAGMAATVMQYAARGARNIANGDFSQNPISRALSSSGSASASLSTPDPATTTRAYEALARKMGDVKTSFDDAQKSSLAMAAGLLQSGQASAQTVDRYNEQTKALEENKRTLESYIKAASSTEKDRYIAQLKETEAALKSANLAQRDRALGLNAMKQAEAEAAAAAERTDQQTRKLANTIEDLTQKNVSEAKSLADRRAIKEQFEDAEKAGIKLSADQIEARERNLQLIKSETAAGGARMTQAQKAAEQDDIALQAIRARTTEERAAVALREAIARQRGQDITGEQALAQQIAAVTRVREEDRMKIVEMIRDQDMQAERIKLERDLLFASADARARAIAMLEKEQELRRQGISPSVPGYREAVTKAADNASDKLTGDAIAKGWEDAKRAVGDFATSFARDMANGVKAADALANAAKNVGRSLVNSGISTAVTGALSGNWAQAGVGAATAGVGLILQALGPSEKHKERIAQIKQAMDEQTKAMKDAQKQQIDAAKRAAEEAAKAAEDAVKRARSYQDRLFAAANDNSTLAGQLAAFDRDAERQRLEETRAGGQALADLEAALYAERARIVRDYIDRAIAEEKRRYDEARQFLDQFARTIRQFVDGLASGAQSPLAPADRLAQAQAQYDRQLALARGGDRDALTGITGYASNLLEAGKAFYASSAGFQGIYNAVTSQLTALPAQVSPEELIVNAIASQTASLSSILNQLDANGDGMISKQEASNTWLSRLFAEVDVNGDGQLSKLELIRYFGEGTKGGVDQVGALQGIANNTASQIAYNTSYMTTTQAQLQEIQNRTGITSRNAARTANNTAGLLNYGEKSGNGIAGDFAYAEGGLVRGPGTETSDSIRARLSNNEFVMRAAAVRRYGVPFMDALNRGAPIALPAMPAPVGNDNSAAAEIRALRSEVAELKRALSAALDTVADAALSAGEHVGEKVDGVRASHDALVRETKLQNSRRAA